MKAMRIDHRNGSYEVSFEPLESVFAALPKDLRIITDANVHAQYRPILEPHAHVKVIEPGEKSKDLSCYGEILSWLATSKASRKTTLCAFGGGVIGDLAGFVAASYMRGVPLHQIPTSLLAQVDSSVGGKVGLDLPEGKNLVGAFYPPTRVSIANELLATLPDRQFVNGMAEVWKYGFILDAALVETLSNEPLTAKSERLPQIVERCIELKAQVVQADEFETLGLRAILNFGHTVGHAVEYAAGYGTLLHGEAISIGMAVESRLGESLGLTPAGASYRVIRRLKEQGLPTTHEVLRDANILVAAMYGDKKAAGGKLAFSLLTDIGRCKLVEDVSERAVREALAPS